MLFNTLIDSQNEKKNEFGEIHLGTGPKGRKIIATKNIWTKTNPHTVSHS